MGSFAGDNHSQFKKKNIIKAISLRQAYAPRRDRREQVVIEPMEKAPLQADW